MLKQMLKKCAEGKTLDRIEAQLVMNEMMAGAASDAQIAGLLSMMRLRGETVEEMTGFALSMKAHSLSLDHQEKKLLDTCGTGGDNLSTFNISTATAILASACGIKVAKHGNRAVSSKSGSADVLERLNIPVQSTPKEAEKALQVKGLCFLFAPLYHQSMKHVAATRKSLGFKTIFNLLGPLVNPARANRQMIGVFDPHFALKMAQTLRELGTERALFVTGGEGIDECSITTYTNIVKLINGKISTHQLTPEEVGIERGELADIKAETVDESAAIIKNIFNGTAHKTAENIVILNCACALYIADDVTSIKEGVQIVKDTIYSGKAFDQFLLLQEKGGVAQC